MALTSLNPTYVGLVASADDALILFEATLQGQLRKVSRRPLEREKAGLAQEGSIFIYEGGEGQIRRWNDGLNWGLSRCRGNVFFYRELKERLSRGKKRDIKREKESGGKGKEKGLGEKKEAIRRDEEGGGEGLKERGLVKKAISISINGYRYCLVSYYTLEGFGGLITPSADITLRLFKPRQELVNALDEITTEGCSMLVTTSENARLKPHLQALQLPISSEYPHTKSDQPLCRDGFPPEIYLEDQILPPPQYHLLSGSPLVPLNQQLIEATNEQYDTSGFTFTCQQGSVPTSYEVGVLPSVQPFYDQTECQPAPNNFSAVADPPYPENIYSRPPLTLTMRY